MTKEALKQKYKLKSQITTMVNFYLKHSKRFNRLRLVELLLKYIRGHNNLIKSIKGRFEVNKYNVREFFNLKIKEMKQLRRMPDPIEKPKPPPRPK